MGGGGGGGGGGSTRTKLLLFISLLGTHMYRIKIKRQKMKLSDDMNYIKMGKRMLL